MEKVVLVTRRSSRASRTAGAMLCFPLYTTSSLQLTPRQHSESMGPSPSLISARGTTLGVAGMRQVQVLGERQKTRRQRLKISRCCFSVILVLRRVLYSWWVSRQTFRNCFWRSISFFSRGITRLKTRGSDSWGLLPSSLPQQLITSHSAAISPQSSISRGIWPSSSLPKSSSTTSRARRGLLSMALISSSLGRKSTLRRATSFLALEEKMLERKEKKPSSSFTEVSLSVFLATFPLSSFSLASISYFRMISKKISSWSRMRSQSSVRSTSRKSRVLSTPSVNPTSSSSCPTFRRQSLTTTRLRPPLQYFTLTSWYFLYSSSWGVRAQSSLPASQSSLSSIFSRVSKAGRGSWVARRAARLKALKQASLRFLLANSFLRPSISTMLAAAMILQMGQCLWPQKQRGSFLSVLPRTQSFFWQRYSKKEERILYLPIHLRGCSMMVGCRSTKLKNSSNRQARTSNVFVFFLLSVNALISLVSGSISGNWICGYSSCSSRDSSNTWLRWISVSCHSPFPPSASPRPPLPPTASSSSRQSGPMKRVRQTVSLEKVEKGLTSTFSTSTLNSGANTCSSFLVSIAKLSLLAELSPKEAFCWRWVMALRWSSLMTLPMEAMISWRCPGSGRKQWMAWYCPQRSSTFLQYLASGLAWTKLNSLRQRLTYLRSSTKPRVLLTAATMTRLLKMYSLTGKQMLSALISTMYSLLLPMLFPNSWSSFRFFSCASSRTISSLFARFISSNSCSAFPHAPWSRWLLGSFFRQSFMSSTYLNMRYCGWARMSEMLMFSFRGSMPRRCARSPSSICLTWAGCFSEMRLSSSWERRRLPKQVPQSLQKLAKWTSWSPMTMKLGFFCLLTTSTVPTIILLSSSIPSNSGKRMLTPSFSSSPCATIGFLMCWMALSRSFWKLSSVVSHSSSTQRRCLLFLILRFSRPMNTPTQQTACSLPFLLPPDYFSMHSTQQQLKQKAISHIQHIQPSSTTTLPITPMVVKTSYNSIPMSIPHPTYLHSGLPPPRLLAAPAQRTTFRLPPPSYPQPQPHFYPPMQSQVAYGQSLPPHYLVQPVPIVRRHPQFDLNPNFDYESANLLCEAKIVESTIFCVVCGSEYRMSEKEQHIQKHVRKAQEKSIDQSVVRRVQEYHQKERKAEYSVRPIVEPEEVDLQFDPNVYQLIQEIIYENEEEGEKREAGIGQDSNNSFNVFDNNVSIPHNNALNILPAIDSQPNPFFSRYDHIEQHQYDIPEFQIPPPPPKQELQVLEDQPIVYNEEAVPPQDKSSHVRFQQTVVQRQEPVEGRASKRFESQQPIREFPPEPVEHYGSKYNSEQQFSGPHRIQESVLSEKKSDISVSQFIKHINSEPIVVEDRRRIPNQSEW